MGHAPCRCASRIRLSALKGITRMRMPSASWIAFAIAAAVGPMLHSPAPSDGLSGRSTSATSTAGTSVKRWIG